MKQIELQKFIFSQKPTRRMLLDYESNLEKKYCIQVFRNHSFELVEHTIYAYLDYADLGVKFEYSGYDDSFSFLELNKNADALIIWIDANRYQNIDLNEFLSQRLNYLREVYTKPILLVCYGQNIAITQSNITIFSLDKISDMLGDKFIDERAKAVTGTSLSNKAMLEISKELGLRYIPALLKPALKAIIVDLDNTLYKGILGEDGIDGIVLTENHRLFQQHLKDLSKQGYFICIASKNELEDVELLFEKRQDFPLKKSDFTKLCVSWNQKANAISELEKYLNIHSSSMVFIDDNIGELTSMNMLHPEVKLIQAYEDASVTLQTLKYFPGLLRLSVNVEDAIRKQDTIANEERRKLQSELSKEEYIKSLKLNLVFAHNDFSHSNRIAELSNKTNQFIFSYKRYSQSDIDMRMKSKDYEIISISLSDKLSDSGLIGVCVGKHNNEYIEIEECFISCRALGRGIDDVIILGAISEISKQFGIDCIKVNFVEGPRNMPAGKFVKEYLLDYLEKPRKFNYFIPSGLLQIDII